MGEVYRARDSRLGREVAVKVLPAELSSDSERLARFVLDELPDGRLVMDSNSGRENLKELALGGAGTARDLYWLTRGNSTDRQPCYSLDGEWVVFSSNRGGNLDLWEI